MALESHPSASRKYNNTKSLLMDAVSLKERMIDSDLNRAEKEKIHATVKVLKLKEQALMYLEDVTDGQVHKGMEQRELRPFIDWVIYDEPLNDIPKHLSKHAFSALNYLRSYINGSRNPQHAREEVSKVLYLESRPELDLDQVENLVLAGGGAKAFSLAGAIKSLEKKNRSDQLKRIAGTSGGAIIAMAYAVGYNSKELESLVFDNQFGLFTLESRLSSLGFDRVSHWFSSGEKEDKLSVVSDNHVASYYHKELIKELAPMIAKSKNPRLGALQGYVSSSSTPGGQVRNLVSALKKHKDGDSYFEGVYAQFSESEILAMVERARKSTAKATGQTLFFNSDVLYNTPKKAFMNAVRHQTGRDIVLGFFQDVIIDKLQHLPKESLQKVFGKELVTRQDLRLIDFVQWKELHDMHPDKIKDLYVTICHRKGLSLSHSNVSHKNEEFRKMPVAEAVRVSMNIPPFFRGYNFEVEGRKYRGTDGGFMSNVSFEAFDNDYDVTKTIGVFYSTEKKLKEANGLAGILNKPTSEEELVRTLDEQNSLIELSQQSLDIHMAQIKSLSPDSKERPILDYAIDRRTAIMRASYGRASAIRDDLERLGQQPGILKRMGGLILKGKSPHSVLTEKLGSKIGEMIGAKSQNDLSKSHNRTRLVMINTRDVDTMHFRLNNLEKEGQLKTGGVAMNSLLKGSYCLEAHFYYNQLRIMSDKLDKSNPELSIDRIPEESRAYQEYDPHLLNSSTTHPDSYCEPAEGPEHLGDPDYIDVRKVPADKSEVPPVPAIDEAIRRRQG